MTTSTAPPTTVTHQKIGALAPMLTTARAEHGLTDLVLFDVDGVVIAFAGGDHSPVDVQVQARAEGLAAIGQRLLSLSRGVVPVKPGEPFAPAELITLRYKSEGGGEVVRWPMAVRAIAGTLGLVGNIAPEHVSDSTAMGRLGYALERLADELGSRVELRPLVAQA